MFALHKSNYKLNPQSFFGLYNSHWYVPHASNHPKTLVANKIVLEINVIVYHKLIWVYPGYFFKVCSKICYVINHLTDT